MFEQVHDVVPEDQEAGHKSSPERLIKALKVFAEMGVKNIEVRGKENLDKIPPGKKVIVVTSHISDIDLPLAAYAVGDRLDIAITTDSFQHHLTENPISNIGFRVAGQDNFLPIEFDKKTRQGRFRPEDFEAMEAALDGGKAIVIAGHAPSVEKDPEKVAWHLPEKGTIGAAYLAEMADAVLVPVSVNIKSEKPTGMGADSIGRGISNMIQTLKGKPDAEVIIGEPISLPQIADVEKFEALMDAKPAEGRREEFRRIRTELQGASDIIIGKLAEMLPVNKRGVWGEEEGKESTSHGDA